MTMHEADRPADHDSVEEADEPGGRDVLTDEQPDAATDTDVDVAEADPEEPGDDEADTAWSREDFPAEDPGEPARAEPDKLAPVGPDSAIDPGTGSYEDRWAGIQAG